MYGPIPGHFTQKVPHLGLPKVPKGPMTIITFPMGVSHLALASAINLHNGQTCQQFRLRMFLVPLGNGRVRLLGFSDPEMIGTCFGHGWNGNV